MLSNLLKCKWILGILFNGATHLQLKPNLMTDISIPPICHTGGHTYILAHIYTCTHIHVHTYIQTHMHTWFKVFFWRVALPLHFSCQVSQHPKFMYINISLKQRQSLILKYQSYLAGSQCEEARPWQGHEEGSWHMQGVLRLQGPLWKFLSMYPNKNLPVFVLCFSTLLTFSGKSQFRALVFCIWKSVSIQKPLWWLSSLPAVLVQLCMWLFEASWPQEAQEA